MRLDFSKNQYLFSPGQARLVEFSHEVGIVVRLFSDRPIYIVYICMYTYFFLEKVKKRVTKMTKGTPIP